MKWWTALLLAWLVLTGWIPGRGQAVKREYEKRIELSEMPAEILEPLHPLLRKTQKIRYYREQSSDGITYEVKGKWRRARWSIEFFEDGRLMDVEELMDWEEIPEEIAARIDSSLRSQFEKYRLTRLQLQFTAPDSSLSDRAVIEAVLSRKTGPLHRRYELEAEVKGPEVLGEFEFLFDQQGQLLEQRPIQRRPLDHVLY